MSPEKISGREHQEGVHNQFNILSDHEFIESFTNPPTQSRKDTFINTAELIENTNLSRSEKESLRASFDTFSSHLTELVTLSTEGTQYKNGNTITLDWEERKKAIRNQYNKTQKTFGYDDEIKKHKGLAKALHLPDVSNELFLKIIEPYANYMDNRSIILQLEKDVKSGETKENGSPLVKMDNIHPYTSEQFLFICDFIALETVVMEPWVNRPNENINPENKQEQTSVEDEISLPNSLQKLYRRGEVDVSLAETINGSNITFLEMDSCTADARKILMQNKNIITRSEKTIYREDLSSFEYPSSVKNIKLPYTNNLATEYEDLHTLTTKITSKSIIDLNNRGIFLKSKGHGQEKFNLINQLYTLESKINIDSTNHDFVSIPFYIQSIARYSDLITENTNQGSVNYDTIHNTIKKEFHGSELDVLIEVSCQICAENGEEIDSSTVLSHLGKFSEEYENIRIRVGNDSRTLIPKTNLSIEDGLLQTIQNFYAEEDTKYNEGRIMLSTILDPILDE